MEETEAVVFIVVKTVLMELLAPMEKRVRKINLKTCNYYAY